MRSTDFSKAIILTIAIVIPILFFSTLSLKEVGISIALGCLLSSPSDVTGTFKHKLTGICAAIILGSCSYVIAGYAAQTLFVLLPVLFILIFGISILAIYGFRASLVTFSGLLAVVLSFANINSEIELWHKGLLIAAGGLWYMCLSMLWYFINPHRPIEQVLAETMELTASYLKIRSNILAGNKDIELYEKQLFQLQTELNTHHESAREILISARKTSGNSGYSRKRLLIFIELVDIFELAMSNPIHPERMKQILSKHPEPLLVLAEFSRAIANQLEKMALAMHKNSKLPINRLPEFQVQTRKQFQEFKNSIDLSQNRETLLLFRNLLDYQEKQVQKITAIYRILNNQENKKNLFFKNKEIQKFITPQEYHFKALADHFTFKSSFFRHSLRLSLVVIIGFLIGYYFSIQNAYWILLTIVVIMRPNYGLTKDRTKQRIIGTLIGGAIAVGIVYVTQNTTVYAILGLGSLTFAFAMIQRNYRTAAVFITLSIIFIYALLQPDILKVIQFRVIDTVVGAGLAALANFLLWPAWESKTIDSIIASSIKTNRIYLKEIDKFYHVKSKLPLSYKLARKNAFLQMGELTSAFQRMTQEPKSKQGSLNSTYKIVGLNQTFLSALAALGTYIRNNPTTKASSSFQIFTDAIAHNLENMESLLLQKKPFFKKNLETEEASIALHENYNELAKKRDIQIKGGKYEIDNKFRLKLQEAHLVTEQLEWLLDISEKLKTLLLKTRTEK